MSGVLVWILVTVSDGSYNRGNVVYSPPLQTLEDCVRIQSYVQSSSVNSKCIQVREVK